MIEDVIFTDEMKCPHCGARLGWDSDSQASELRYAPNDVSVEEDVAVSSYCCRECNRSYDVFFEDGICHLLSEFDENVSEEEAHEEFTNYAINTFMKRWEKQ